MPLEELRERAFEISLELDHPIYDRFYLALARERAPLVCADGSLKAKKLTQIEIRTL